MDQRTAPISGRAARAIRAAILGLSSVLAGTAVSIAADLDLRGGFHGPAIVEGDEVIILDGTLVPRGGFDDAPRVIDVQPRPDVLPDLPLPRQDSSILRLGTPETRRAVADGRVERPAPRPGAAGSLPGGGDREGGLVVVRQDVRDLIGQVARFYGFDTVLTRQVQGEIRNETLPSDFEAFLERLTNDRSLVFYFRDRELNASARSENVSRVIGLGPSNPTELRAAIEAAGVDADRFPLQFIEGSNSVLVNAPPSFVGLVEVIAESLVRTDRSSADVTVIRGNQIDRTAPDSIPPRPPVAGPAPAVVPGG